MPDEPLEDLRKAPAQARLSRAVTSGRLRRWFREPLVGFLFVGVLLFVLDLWRRPGDDRVVRVSSADEERLSALWYGQMQRAPTAQELDRLVEEFVREEILVREAQRRGLDRDDVIVRRRLAQKLSFLLEDSTPIADPDEETLQRFFASNAERYRQPSRVSFQHVYFSRALHGERAQQVALAEKRALERAPATDWRELGDPFMLLREYADRTEDEIAADFGGPFASALFTLPIGEWQGPISSAVGLHLVHVRGREHVAEVQLDAVRARVVEDWRDERRRAENERAFAALRDEYRVQRSRSQAVGESSSRGAPEEVGG